MTAEIWVALAGGAVGGFFAGRYYAELAAARYDARRRMRARRDYRRRH